VLIVGALQKMFIFVFYPCQLMTVCRKMNADYHSSPLRKLSVTDKHKEELAGYSLVTLCLLFLVDCCMHITNYKFFIYRPERINLSITRDYFWKTHLGEHATLTIGCYKIQADTNRVENRVHGSQHTKKIVLVIVCQK